MKKLVLSVVTALCIIGITYAFAAELQNTDSAKDKSSAEIQKAIPEKSKSEVIIRETVPSKVKHLDKNAAKLANAVLPKVTYPTMSHQLGYEGSKFSITVRFNTDMDRNTVIAGSTVIQAFRMPSPASIIHLVSKDRIVGIGRKQSGAPERANEPV